MSDELPICRPVPCPAFEDVTLEITAVCDCHGRIPLGRQYASGCPIHDPLVGLKEKMP